MSQHFHKYENSPSTAEEMWLTFYYVGVLTTACAVKISFEFVAKLKKKDFR